MSAAEDTPHNPRPKIVEVVTKDAIVEQNQRISQQFRDFREHVDKRFDAVDKRFDGVEQRFDGTDKRLDGVDQRLESQDEKLDAILALLQKK